jgi:hypothetical protein
MKTKPYTKFWGSDFGKGLSGSIFFSFSKVYTKSPRIMTFSVSIKAYLSYTLVYFVFITDVTFYTKQNGHIFENSTTSLETHGARIMQFTT